MKALLSIIITAFLLLLSPPLESQTGLPRDLDSYVDKVRATFEVPGMSVAVVKDGKIVLTKGYGVRRMGAQGEVDEHTLFGIASNTKLFTATAIGLLVEEGKLSWDAPVVNDLPWFQLSDPYVTRELSVRDLLVHRSGLGLGSGDLLWWPASTYNRKDIARRLRYLPLLKSFRSAYAYDNVLYLVAGELIETVSGQTWEDFVAKRILSKVGMSESNVRHSSALAGGNVASTHARINGSVRPVKPFDSDNTNPAGGINSNAHDMGRWMICQLDSGRTMDGARLFSPQTARQLWSIVTPLGTGNGPPELPVLRTDFNGYALGLGVRDYRGKKMLTHTGGLPGYVSRVMMIPDLRLGVAILTNQESGEAFDAVAYHIVDSYLGAAPFDWVGGFKRLRARADSTEAAAEKGAESGRNAASKPSLPLDRYTGTFVDTWYGEISIEQKEGLLRMRFGHTPELVGRLEHFQYDTFIARWDDPELRADAYVTFALNPDGTINHALMKAVSPATDFSFDFQDLLLKPAAVKK